MDIRNNLQNLQDIFRTNGTAPGKAVSHSANLENAASDISDMGGDEATVSTTASLANQAASLPDVRQEKVDAVRSALDSGSYNVSSSAVATTLIDNMLNS